MNPLISPLDIAMVVALVISVIILGFASVVLYKILKGDIKMDRIISESDGKKPACRGSSTWCSLSSSPGCIWSCRWKAAPLLIFRKASCCA